MKYLPVFLLICMCSLPVSAKTVEETKNEKVAMENELIEMQSSIENIESQKNILNQEIENLYDEITDNILNIEILKSDIQKKETEIEEAKIAYEEAKEKEEKQYKLVSMYVSVANTITDGVSQLGIELESASVQDDATYCEYQALVQETAKLKEELENDNSELNQMKDELEEKTSQLENLISLKKQEILNFDDQLDSIKEEAIQKKEEIEKKEQEIKELNGTKEVVFTLRGQTRGDEIIDYALQFLGNPYKYGGTSLTNGTDCSGFTQSVFAHFGISLARTSGDQARGGITVSRDEMMPGDIICYYGHVGIYIGDGQIVHASTEKSGIKIGNMNYRTIKTIQRYW